MPELADWYKKRNFMSVDELIHSLHHSQNSKKSLGGFTLAELLIALLILGVISTFTIPKILSAQANGQYKSTAKEEIAAIAAAYQNLYTQTGITSSTSINAFTQYLNYVAVDTASVVDNTTASAATTTCTAAGLVRCLKLHNGGMLLYHNAETFGGTNTTNGIWLIIDPDGIASSNKGLAVFLLYNGRVSSEANLPSITSSITTYTMSTDPAWFSW